LIEHEKLISLALGELAEAEADEVDAHVLACGACATVLERLLRLGPLVRDLVREGAVAFPVTAALADRLRREGLVSRSYRIAKDDAVPCSVAAEDVYALTTLEVDAHGVERVDVVVTFPLGAVRMDDVPFDRDAGLVRYVTQSRRLRLLPSCRVVVEVLASDARGERAERTIGRYFLDHTAFAGA
jgi:hypothetical protein